MQFLALKRDFWRVFWNAHSNCLSTHFVLTNFYKLKGCDNQTVLFRYGGFSKFKKCQQIPSKSVWGKNYHGSKLQIRLVTLILISPLVIFDSFFPDWIKRSFDTAKIYNVLEVVTWILKTIWKNVMKKGKFKKTCDTVLD